MSLENTTDSVTPEPQAPLEAPALVAEAPLEETAAPLAPIEPPRGAIAEWAITILLLLFLTTTLVRRTSSRRAPWKTPCSSETIC